MESELWQKRTLELKTGPRSQLLITGIELFKEMLNDPLYTFDDLRIHHVLPDGKVGSNFGGSLIRHLMGPSFHCTPANLFDYPWATLVCQLNHLRRGEIRACFPRVDDKTYRKFFKKEAYPISSRLETLDPILLDQLDDLVKFLQKVHM